MNNELLKQRFDDCLDTQIESINNNTEFTNCGVNLTTLEEAFIKEFERRGL